MRYGTSFQTHNKPAIGLWIKHNKPFVHFVSERMQLPQIIRNCFFRNAFFIKVDKRVHYDAKYPHRNYFLFYFFGLLIFLPG